MRILDQQNYETVVGLVEPQKAGELELMDFQVTDSGEFILPYSVISYLTGEEVNSLTICRTYHTRPGEHVPYEVIGYRYECDLGRTPIFFHPQDCVQYMEIMLATNRRLNVDPDTVEVTQDLTISGMRTGLFALVSYEDYKHFRTGRVDMKMEVFSISTKEQFQEALQKADTDNKKLVRISLSMWKDIGTPNYE